MRWIVKGRNRRVGSIGAFERFTDDYVEAHSRDEAINIARQRRYAAGFEHVDSCTASLVKENPR